MKYFFDTEFITGFKRPIGFLPTIGSWNKKEFFIHLVSIGIVSEDGREYYAISKEFNAKLADDWVKENVLDKLPRQIVGFYDSPREKQGARYWKSNKKIAKELKEFIYKTSQINNPDTIANFEEVKHLFPIEFYAYYADYDWVVFCSLFGRMMDLPKGFPMYCRDLKQVLDQKANDFTLYADKTKVLENNIDFIKKMPNYPKQQNEHHALADAKWNYELFKFLQSI